MIERIKELILPKLMAEGMLSPDFVDVIALDRLWISKSGELMAPPDFAQTCRKQRPHLFKVQGYRKPQPDSLRNDVFKQTTIH